METKKAKVTVFGEKHFIKIEDAHGDISIPISEDKPADVKSAFNKLILLIKNGEFKIELVDVSEDLIALVAKEYVAQLNKEIHEVRNEMKQRGLVAK